MTIVPPSKSEYGTERQEEIMSEMQTLTVAPQSRNEEDVSDGLKTKLLEWLIIDVRLLKPMNAKSKERLK